MLAGLSIMYCLRTPPCFLGERRAAQRYRDQQRTGGYARHEDRASSPFLPDCRSIARRRCWRRVVYLSSQTSSMRQPL